MESKTKLPQSVTKNSGRGNQPGIKAARKLNNIWRVYIISTTGEMIFSQMQQETE